jgi:hypothetical protein
MCPSPEEVAGDSQVAGADATSAPAEANAVPPSSQEATAEPATEPTTEPATEPAAEPAAPTEKKVDPPKNLLLYTVFGFLCIGVALWLVLAWAGYKEKYSQHTEGWHLGATRMIEITLVREDKKNLACASDKTFGNVHCGYLANSQPTGTTPESDPNVLQPFNTVKNELFLAAGLWQSPILREPLPKERFTVVCNYHVLGVLKAVSLRWATTGSFSPVDQSVAAGNLTDCAIPQ